MKKAVTMNKYYKFLMYVVIIVLINIAGITLFFRLDLTSGNIYSLSEASKNVVKTLSDPLTVKVFFTGNLPAPYNNIERYLHDLLEEYAIAGNRYFNYQFYNVSSDEEEKTRENRELAQNYGIHPVQIQNIEQDEVKFQKAHMGMVLIHGDIIETIPTITSTDGLEYRITSTIRKMNNKISALLRLKENIEVKLYLSSSLQAVGPYLNLPGLSGVPGKIERVVDKLKDKNYGKLSFFYIDTTLQNNYEKDAALYKILALKWDDFSDRRGKTIQADRGYAGIVIKHGEKHETIQLINVIRMPIFGTQYQLAEMDLLEKTIDETVENILGVNEEIGYLADHGTYTLSDSPHMPGQTGGQDSLSNFNKLVSESYTLKQVNIKESGIPESLSFLIIAGARENFSDYELYQIDQFLMKGKNLAIFMDAFKEVMPAQQGRMRFNQQPYYIPLETGLEKLLYHYGLNVSKSYILDENAFKQRIPQAFGGGEQLIYYAPIIKNEMINKNVNFLKNIKGLVMLKASPVSINDQKLQDYGLKATRLFSSSERSWEMSGRINLNPVFIQPPKTDGKFKSMEIAYILEGSFPSYFADKSIPEKENGEDSEDNSDTEDKEKTTGIDTTSIMIETAAIKKGAPGKIFLIGTSEILKNNIVDEDGTQPNSQFVMNVIDYLNNRENTAVMRTKSQRFNPLKDISPGTKTVIKTANIAGLPVLVVIAGLIVWFRRASRKRVLQQIFRR